jgi:hypothetical protein
MIRVERGHAYVPPNHRIRIRDARARRAVAFIC